MKHELDSEPAWLSSPSTIVESTWRYPMNAYLIHNVTLLHNVELRDGGKAYQYSKFSHINKVMGAAQRSLSNYVNMDMTRKGHDRHKTY